MTCLTDCNAPVVGRNYLYTSNWELRHRIGWSGLYGIHNNADTQNFNSSFHSRLGSAMWIINHYASNDGHGSIQWIGNVGAQAWLNENQCKPGCHSSGDALDITALNFDNTNFDMNVSWRSDQSLVQQRGYLAIWAGLRVYCKTVLGHEYQDHDDHFHVDHGANNLLPPAIRTNTTDTTLIQSSCNLLNNAQLSVDGQWGPLTTTAYNNLLNQLSLSCASPTTNYWHARTLLILIMRHGFASRLAGHYTYPYC